MNCLFRLNEVEVVGVFMVVFVGKDGELGRKCVGNRKIFARIFADVGKMWGKLGNRKSLKPLITRL